MALPSQSAPLMQRANRSRLAPPSRFMSEKGWWEEEGVPEVEDPFQEDEGGAVGNLVAIVLRTLAVIIIFYISTQVEYL